MCMAGKDFAPHQNLKKKIVQLQLKICTPPETAILYAVKKLMVTTINTAGTTLLSWNKTNIFHGYNVENYHCKMISYPKFPFPQIILFDFDFPLIASQLDIFSSHVGSFIANKKVENMYLEGETLPDVWEHKSVGIIYD